MKEKFFKRLNAHFLTLAEFLMWYEPVKNKSTERFMAYKETLGSIPDSKVTNLDASDFLPEVILISTGDVLELRKSRKVLIVKQEDMTKEEKEKCQYILFSKYLYSDDVDKDDVNYMLQVIVACENISLPLMESRKKRLFPYLLKETL